MLRKWWQRLSNRSNNRSRRPRLFTLPLHLESLEERTVLSSPAVLPPAPLAIASASIATPDYILTRPQGVDHPLSSPGPVGYKPSQITQAYGINQIQFNGIKGDGTGQTIAIIDAYDDPKISTDLATFDSTLGLPAPPSFRKVAQDGSTNFPSVQSGGGGWEVEESLDVEWAHALAPGANILLVEANSANDSDLNTAVNYARNLPGVSVISMSYGENEFTAEGSEDTFFRTPSGHAGVTFVAATGDSGEPGDYPAYSPYVVAAGGTKLLLTSTNNWSSESGWTGSGGGISQYEPQPSYQNGVVSAFSTTARTIPDVAFDASPSTGVAICDSYNYGSTAPWVSVGGTSVSAPCWAALIAIADQDRALNGLGSMDGFTQTLPRLYQLPSSDFHDITSGSNGYYYINGVQYPSTAGPGYDLVTGLGSPIANLLVPDLANVPTTPTTLKWTGGGSNSNWSNPQNWGGYTPVAGDSLVFGPGAAAQTSTNDLAAGTQFNSITFSGAGYTISGNAVTLTGGINASNATGNNTLSLAVSLANNETISGGGSGTTLTLAGAINNQGNTLTVAGGSGAVVLANTVSGSGALIENSSGTLTLSGTTGNSFTGGTTVQAGTLVLDETGGSALGRSLTVGTGAGTALAQWQAGNQLAAGTNVTVGGSGTIDLNGHSDTVAALTLLGGTVQTESGTLTLTGNVSASGTSALNGNLALAAGDHSVNVTSSSTLTVSAAVSSSGSLRGVGLGTFVLSGANSYTGGTVLNNGTLAVGNGKALGSGVLTLNGGTLSSSGGAQTLANGIVLGGNASLGATSNLTFTGSVTLTGNRTLSVGSGATATFTGVIAQSGTTAYSFKKNGPGTLVLSAADTYAGGTILNGGTLAVGNAKALGSGVLTLNGGTLSSSGGAQTLANVVTFAYNSSVGASSNLTLTGSMTLTGNRTLTVGSGATVTITGSIGQSGSTAYALSKSGSGTLTLSGVNSYTGSTTVKAGTLLIDGSQAGGTVYVSTSAVLGGSGSMGPVSVSAGGTLQPGATVGASGILSSGNVSFSSGSTFAVSLNGATAGAGGYDQLSVSGSVNLGGSTLKLSLSFTPTVGESFTILNNSGGGAVVGTFANLPEGGTLSSGGMTFRISYVGGNGRSVVLTRIA